MVNAVTAGLSLMPGAYGQGKLTIVETTPAMKARLEEADRRSAHVMKVQKDYEDAWSKRGAAGSSGMQLGDVATQSPQQAVGNLAAMTKLRDAYGDNAFQVSATRGTEKTTSLSTYIS